MRFQLAGQHLHHRVMTQLVVINQLHAAALFHQRCNFMLDLLLATRAQASGKGDSDRWPPDE